MVSLLESTNILLADSSVTWSLRQHLRQNVGCAFVVTIGQLTEGNFFQLRQIVGVLSSVTFVFLAWNDPKEEIPWGLFTVACWCIWPWILVGKTPTNLCQLIFLKKITQFELQRSLRISCPNEDNFETVPLKHIKSYLQSDNSPLIVSCKAPFITGKLLQVGYEALTPYTIL